MPFSLWKKSVKVIRKNSVSDISSDSSSRNSSLSTQNNNSETESCGDDLERPLGSPEWLALSKLCFETSWSSPNSVNSEQEIQLSEFRQLKKIASGCFGPIILVRQKGTDNYFALKVLQKNYVYKLQQIKKAETEKRILQSINFPFLVNLKYCSQDSINLYLFMEYLPGGDMWHLMQRQRSTGRQFCEANVRFYVSQVILALEYLHYLDFIYRDLKPENILIDVSGYIKIGDFGYTKRIRHDGRAMTQCGTRDYMSPEIILGQSYNRAVDYWALGVLIYEFITGVTPFFSQSKMESFEKIVSGKYIAPKNVSKEVKELIQKFLIVEANRRLGCGKNGFQDIKSNSWFSSAKFSWDDILHKKLKAPFTPQLKNFGDTKYFTSTPTSTDLSNNTVTSQPLFKQQESSTFVDYYDKYFENF